MGCFLLDERIVNTAKWPWGETEGRSGYFRGVHDIFGNASIDATYPFDGNANDLGGAYSGTVHNVSFADAFRGKCLHFSGGTDEYVDTPYKTNGGSYSLSAIVFPESLVSPGNNVCAIFAETSETNRSYGTFSHYSEKQFWFGHYKNVAGNYDVAGTESIYDIGNWYHVVFVRQNGDSHKIYVNGDLAASASCASVANESSYTMRIGKDYYSTARNFIGKIDQARVFNRALSASEVLKLYKGEL
jgi:hypothetical protein